MTQESMIIELQHDLQDITQRVTKLERLTTGEDGYMLISVPVGSYILPPKEVDESRRLSELLKLGEDLFGPGTKSAEKLFTQEDMVSFAIFCDPSDQPVSHYERQLHNWKP